MNPYRAYQQQSMGWTRIEMLLALFDGAIQRLEKAIILRQADPVSSESFNALSRAQVIVMALASGVKVEVNPEVNTNILRLYEYVVHNIAQGTEKHLQDSIKILKMLREGFDSIRGEAVELERRGQIPSADSLCMLHTTA